MKKQFFPLMLIALALFTSISSAFGQVTYTKNLTGAPTCTPAVPLTCSSGADALHPIPGVAYDYTVTVNPAVATGGYVHWFVTTSSTIIDGTGTTPSLTPTLLRDKGDGTGNYILLADVAKYDLTTNLSPTINISWKYFDGAQQVLLVAYVMDNTGCTNNVEVYRITPTFSFTLDMAALLDAGTVGNSECVSTVESANYTAGNLTMNYGENWVFFSVNAANFVHSWMPAFTVVSYTGTGVLAAAVPVADIQWAYPTDAVANTAWNAVTAPVLAKAATGAVGAAGECIVVRARIVHNKDQVLAATTLTLGVDGTMRNPAGAGDYTTPALKDLDNPTTTGVCVNNITDQSTYTITPRPTIATGTIGVAPNTNPGPFIPKN